MWLCPKCHRQFSKTNQSHSCHQVPLSQHFANKAHAQAIFDHLVDQINHHIGQCKIVSIPCCVHLFGQYDFLAALPKKDHLEIRFSLDHQIKSSRVKLNFPLSAHSYKICIDLYQIDDIDHELISWLKEAYLLKNL